MKNKNRSNKEAIERIMPSECNQQEALLENWNWLARETREKHEKRKKKIGHGEVLCDQQQATERGPSVHSTQA